MWISCDVHKVYLLKQLCEEEVFYNMFLKFMILYSGIYFIKFSVLGSSYVAAPDGSRTPVCY